MKQQTDHDFLTPEEFEAWLYHPGWAWFKRFAKEMAEAHRDNVMNIDPTKAAWEISKAQGYYEAFSAFENGIGTPQGQVSFENYLMDRILEARAESNKS